MFTCTYIHTCTNVHTYLSMYKHVCTHTNTHTYNMWSKRRAVTRMCTRTHTHTHTHGQNAGRCHWDKSRAVGSLWDAAQPSGLCSLCERHRCVLSAWACVHVSVCLSVHLSVCRKSIHTHMTAAFFVLVLITPDMYVCVCVCIYIYIYIHIHIHDTYTLINASMHMQLTAPFFFLVLRTPRWSFGHSRL